MQYKAVKNFEDYEICENGEVLNIKTNTIKKPNVKSENSLNRNFPKVSTNKVYQYSLDWELVKEWESIGDVAKYYKCDSKTISKNFDWLLFYNVNIRR